MRHDVPILVAPSLRSDELAVDGGDAQKRGQIEYFDRPSDDFGVTRPRGAPELYGALLREKFRRSVFGIEHVLPGATALVVCGGSGVDAEFLIQAGARVILSDISLGVVLQARERALRFGLDLDLVVADVEALPFADQSIDVVYVHDGLHHLGQPTVGLSEMARVARIAVSVNEPSRSAATTLAVKLRIAETSEEAGNLVARLDLEEVIGELRRLGLQPIRPHRYFMFYRHWPGPIMRGLSVPLARTLTLATLRLANRVGGRYGNKLTVQARRRDT